MSTCMDRSKRIRFALIVLMGLSTASCVTEKNDDVAEPKPTAFSEQHLRDAGDVLGVAVLAGGNGAILTDNDANVAIIVDDPSSPIRGSHLVLNSRSFTVDYAKGPVVVTILPVPPHAEQTTTVTDGEYISVGVHALVSIRYSGTGEAVELLKPIEIGAPYFVDLAGGEAVQLVHVVDGSLDIVVVEEGFAPYRSLTNDSVQTCIAHTTQTGTFTCAIAGGTHPAPPEPQWPGFWLEGEGDGKQIHEFNLNTGRYTQYFGYSADQNCFESAYEHPIDKFNTTEASGCGFDDDTAYTNTWTFSSVTEDAMTFTWTWFAEGNQENGSKQFDVLRLEDGPTMCAVSERSGETNCPN